MGRGAESAKTYIIDDMIIIRLKGVLTAAEKELAREEKGKAWLRKCDTNWRKSFDQNWKR